MSRRPLYCAAGDIHGALSRFYADVLAFEGALGETFHPMCHPSRERARLRGRRVAAGPKRQASGGRSSPSKSCLTCR
jgi:hypothetical protein